MIRAATPHEWADREPIDDRTEPEILMSASSDRHRSNGCYELRFRSLYEPGRGYTFPCDAAGRVDLDALSDGERQSYLYARALVGGELSVPAVQLSDR